jgi:hypothetical protein
MERDRKRLRLLNISCGGLLKISVFVPEGENPLDGMRVSAFTKVAKAARIATLQIGRTMKATS